MCTLNRLKSTKYQPKGWAMALNPIILLTKLKRYILLCKLWRVALLPEYLSYDFISGQFEYHTVTSNLTWLILQRIIRICSSKYICLICLKKHWNYPSYYKYILIWLEGFWMRIHKTYVTLFVSYVRTIFPHLGVNK